MIAYYVNQSSVIKNKEKLRPLIKNNTSGIVLTSFLIYYLLPSRGETVSYI